MHFNKSNDFPDFQFNFSTDIHIYWIYVHWCFFAYLVWETASFEPFLWSKVTFYAKLWATLHLHLNFVPWMLNVFCSVLFCCCFSVHAFALDGSSESQ